MNPLLVLLPNCFIEVGMFVCPVMFDGKSEWFVLIQIFSESPINFKCLENSCKHVVLLNVNF